MSNIKTNRTARFSEIFKALSNPHRLKIFMRLAASCAKCGRYCAPGEVSAYVGELGRDLGIAPSTVSHHIKELNRAGLIVVERNGQNVKCWIKPKMLAELSGFFSRLNET